MERIKIELEPVEFSALVRMCEQELRPLPDQVRHLVREALMRRGLLGAPAPCATPAEVRNVS